MLLLFSLAAFVAPPLLSGVHAADADSDAGIADIGPSPDTTPPPFPPPQPADDEETSDSLEPPWPVPPPPGSLPYPDGRLGPPPQPGRRWDDADRRLEACRREYARLEEARIKLLDELARVRQRYQPDQMNPASVLAYKAMDRLLGQLHKLAEKSRANAEEAGRILAGALATRTRWEPLLRRELDSSAPPLPAEVRARRELWLGALKRLDKEGEAGFARALLGDGFGPLALEAVPEEWDRLAPGPPGQGGRGHRMRPMGEMMRQRWLDRLDRLQRRQEDLAQQVERQQREIERLRRLLEAPAPPAASPSAPGQKLRPEANPSSPSPTPPTP